MADFGLIGNPLGHSFSPEIHRMLGSYPYSLFPLLPEELEPFLKKGDFQGLNVTIPYKKAVIPYCAALTEDAKAIGSVNTLVRQKDGTLLGHNTDLYGLLYLIRRTGIDLSGKKVLIFGSGGTSLTAREAAKREGAEQVVVISRKGPESYDTLTQRHSDAQVLINTTPLGMFPKEGAMAASPRLFPHLEGVLDVVYNPLRTAFLQQAREMGIPHSGGLPMLVAQAKAASQCFTQTQIPDERIEEICRTLLSSWENVVLVGMPGAGKTALGQLTAALLNRPFVDLDAQIEKQAQKPIPAIFQEDGEEAFRQMESRLLREYSREKGLVIATGGGAVLREDNRMAIEQNAFVVWVRRDLCQLDTQGRPLSQGGMEALQALALAREPLYRKVSQYIVENSGTPQQGAQKIAEAFYETSHH